MYKNILVPIATDHNPNTGQALEIAHLLGGGEAKITALTVVEEVPMYVSARLPEQLLENAREEAVVALKAEVGGQRNVKAEVRVGHAARTILEVAEELGADCIVIASHRPNYQDYFLGSTAARVVRHSKCAVHVIR